MGAGLGVATETRNEGKVEVELVLEPVDGGGAVVHEDLGEIRGNIGGTLAGRESGILEELSEDETRRASRNRNRRKRTISAESGTPLAIWVRVRAPLIPEVALVELPPRRAF